MAAGLLRSILAPFVLAFAAGRCGVGGTAGPGASDPVPDPSATTRILFVGNSLTYVNDLPGMVKALADSAGVPGVQTAQIAKPDYALEDHWADGQAPGVINRGGWHVVVLQQGPSSQPDSRVNLRHFAGVLAELIRAKDGLPALYMVWPSVSRPQDFEGSSESYRLAAEDVNGLLLAAGDAWRAAWRRDPAIPLYGPDGFHPSLQGTYLAALTAFGALFHRSVLGSPDGLRTPAGSFQLPHAQARLLQESADEVNAALIH